MAKMGRPRIQIDWNAFDKLCELQCTREEIASFFDCHADTIDNAVKREKGETFSEYYKKKQGKGKIALRRMQFRIAEKSATMAIFLGKNYLGQRDHYEVDNSEALGKLDQLLSSIDKQAND